MNILLAWLLFAVLASTTSTVIGRCADQYGHCKEWSKAGFCNIIGYKTYMTVMCAYSCNHCQDHIEMTRSSGDEREDESGSGIDQQAEDVSSTAEQSNSANEAVNPNVGVTTVDRPEPQRSEIQYSTTVNQGNQQERAADQDEMDEQEKQSETVSTVPKDTNPPGVREVVMPATLDDNIDPRSKIAAPPVKQLHAIVKKLKKTITDTQIANQKIISDSNPTNQREVTETTPTNEEETSGESQSDEMKDIAGEVTRGSKIFEEDISESESTSGCASGYGCFSEPGEQVKEAQAEETQELESRSKIDVPESYKPPHVDSGIQDEKASTTQKTIDGHGEDVDGETKKTAKSIDIPKKHTDQPKDIDHEQYIDREKPDDKPSASGNIPSETNAPLQPTTIDPTLVHENETKGAFTDDSRNGSGNHTITIEKQSSETTDKGTEDSQQNDNTNDEPSENTVSGSKQSSETTDKGTKDSQQNDNTNDEPSENTVSGSGEGLEANTKQRLDSIDEVSKEDIEENINEISKSTDKLSSEKKDIDSDTMENSGSGSTPQQYIDETQNDVPEETKIESKTSEIRTEDISGSGSGHRKAEVEEDNIEDALYEKGATKTEAKTKQTGTLASDKNKETLTENQELAAQSKDLASDKNKETSTENQELAALSKDSHLASDKNKETLTENQELAAQSKNLASDKNKERLNSMEELINNGKLKPQDPVDAQANTREEMPDREEEKQAEKQFIANEIGKSHRVSIILDQHYYKPYTNEDSMAYEMLALDLKKEVERSVGNQALVSQITFREIKKPGKLPTYSRVLAKFTLNGDEDQLRKAAEKGVVGGMMVDKYFFQTS